MPELALLRDLALAVLAAFAGGLVAQRLGQPVIVGYLVAGVAIGPFTPGPIARTESIQLLAEIGVAFLMFSLGAELTLAEVRRVGRVAVWGGIAQIAATVALGPLLAVPLGLSFREGVFLGAILALSSTVVAVKLLMARGELDALHGRVSLGILIVQDLAVVPMVILLPSLARDLESGLAEVGLVVLKGGALVLAAFLVGTRVVPAVLGHAAGRRSRELFLLAVVALALGTALLTELAGLSLAFGAFIAGLVIAESEYRVQVVAEALPLRDLFTSLFFVSVGMLVDPSALLAHLDAVALVSAAAIAGKLLIVLTIVLFLGMPGRVALLAGLALAQIGEFSFVLARVGTASGALPRAAFDLVLATAVLSIVLAPFLLRAGPGLLSLARMLPVLGTRFADPVVADPRADALRRHTVLCGFGRVARELADALAARGFPYLVIEYNPLVVGELRARGVAVIYGDAANPAVLAHARLADAALLAVLVPDSTVTEAATRHARAANPRLDIVARATDAAQIERLQAAGATDVVQPEFEAGVEVIRHVLGRYGITGTELSHVVSGRRRSFYARGDEGRGR